MGRLAFSPPSRSQYRANREPAEEANSCELVRRHTAVGPFDYARLLRISITLLGLGMGASSVRFS
jgi:hypothetical protein